jgi:integrase/recombinase XerD
MAEISPLRRRMIEDMTVRNLSPATQQARGLKTESRSAA